MGHKGDNPYYVLGKKIAELRKDIELVLYSCGIYDWPSADQEFIDWVSKTPKINESNKEYIRGKFDEILTLEKSISDRLNAPPSDHES